MTGTDTKPSLEHGFISQETEGTERGKSHLAQQGTKSSGQDGQDGQDDRKGAGQRTLPKLYHFFTKIQGWLVKVWPLLSPVLGAPRQPRAVIGET
jgi:hypothetical protein